MEVRSRQQNLGFGTLHVKIDGEKLEKQTVKKIETHIHPNDSKMVLYSRDGSIKKMVATINRFSNDSEIALAQKLRELGAKVARTIKDTTTNKIQSRNINWFNKQIFQSFK